MEQFNRHSIFVLAVLLVLSAQVASAAPSGPPVTARATAQSDIDRAKTFKTRADRYFIEGRREEEALRDIDTAIRLNPRDCDAYRVRVDVLFNMRRKKEAVLAMEKRIELFPEEAQPYASRAAYEAECGNFSAAIKDNTRAISLNPEYAGAHHDLACDYLDTREYRKGLVEIDRAIELEQEQRSTSDHIGLSHKVRGDLRSAVGDRAGAIKDYDVAIPLTIWSDKLVTKRAQLKFEIGDLQGALVDCNMPNKLSYDRQNKLFLRAQVNFALGHFGASAQDFLCASADILGPYLILLLLTFAGNVPFLAALNILREKGVPTVMAR